MGRAPVQPGEPTPDFTLPAIHRRGTVSLADYRGLKVLAGQPPLALKTLVV